jgi:hypothetical protein
MAEVRSRRSAPSVRPLSATAAERGGRERALAAPPMVVPVQTRGLAQTEQVAGARPLTWWGSGGAEALPASRRPRSRGAAATRAPASEPVWMTRSQKRAAAAQDAAALLGAEVGSSAT